MIQIAHPWSATLASVFEAYTISLYNNGTISSLSRTSSTSQLPSTTPRHCCNLSNCIPHVLVNQNAIKESESMWLLCQYSQSACPIHSLWQSIIPLRRNYWSSLRICYLLKRDTFKNAWTYNLMMYTSLKSCVPTWRIITVSVLKGRFTNINTM